MNGQGPPFYGKFRGVVTDNRDPLALGRICAKVPDVFGDNDSGWALPALPYAGNNVGLFLVPPENASVWIEFEHGNTEYPVWSGCFWIPGGKDLPPATPGVAEMKVLKTDKCTITINDLIGSIAIETEIGAKIEIGPEGIEINTGVGGSIKLTGPQVSINDGALEVI